TSSTGGESVAICVSAERPRTKTPATIAAPLSAVQTVTAFDWAFIHPPQKVHRRGSTPQPRDAHNSLREHVVNSPPCCTHPNAPLRNRGDRGDRDRRRLRVTVVGSGAEPIFRIGSSHAPTGL